MAEFGVFAAVAESVQEELVLAQAPLQRYPELPPTPLLLGLCDVLQAQVAGLQRAG